MAVITCSTVISVLGNIGKVVATLGTIGSVVTTIGGFGQQVMGVAPGLISKIPVIGKLMGNKSPLKTLTGG